MTTDTGTGPRAQDGYELVVDGRRCRVDGPAMRPLVAALREDLGITGPKVSCEIGVCGACSVLVDGQLLSACLLPVAVAAGHEVTTVAGLTPPDGLSPVQAAFVAHGAAQCGFCTPGQIVAAAALLAEDPHPSPATAAAWLAGNLCRCTGYETIVEAVVAAGSGPS